MWDTSAPHNARHTPVGRILRRDARATGRNSSVVTSPIDPTNEQDLGGSSTLQINATFSKTTILIDYNGSLSHYSHTRSKYNKDGPTFQSFHFIQLSLLR